MTPSTQPLKPTREAEVPRPAVVGEIRTEYVAPPRRADAFRVKRATLVSILLVVVLPTLATAIYMFAFAADIFESEARFRIRGQDSSLDSAAAPSPGMFFGLVGGGGAQNESLSVAEYLKSRDALAAAEQRLDLRAMYQRPEADFYARLPDDATFEELYEKYRDMTGVSYDPMSGIVTLSVRAFRPGDAVAIADTLLEIGEELVNAFNIRAEQDLLKLARAEVTRAEERMTENREALTLFRNANNQIDPSQTSGAILGLVAELEGQIAQTEADLAERRSYMRPDSLEITSLEAKLQALTQQVAKENARLTGAESALAEVLATYEVLLLERELANRSYESALASLEAARTDAIRQHHYLVRVVSPNLADEEAFPRRWESVATVLLGAFMVFAFGRLVLAGIRDHIIK